MSGNWFVEESLEQERRREQAAWLQHERMVREASRANNVLRITPLKQVALSIGTTLVEFGEWLQEKSGGPVSKANVYVSNDQSPQPCA